MKHLNLVSIKPAAAQTHRTDRDMRWVSQGLNPTYELTVGWVEPLRYPSRRDRATRRPYGPTTNSAVSIVLSRHHQTVPAMIFYRRNFIAGGSFFFTVNLAERRLRLLTQHIDELRSAFRETRRRHPFTIDAMVVLPDHLHAVWTLPEGDAEPLAGG